MDEPFSALDTITREEMQELFLDIWKENKVTTVFITHCVDEAIYLGRKIAVMSPSLIVINVKIFQIFKGTIAIHALYSIGRVLIGELFLYWQGFCLDI